MLDLLTNSRLLVVVAHPDDEVLGLGGTVHRAVTTRGCDAHALVLGEGITSRADARAPEAWAAELATHRRNMADAARHVGYAQLMSHDFPDNRFDTVALLDLVKTIERAVETLRPNVVLTHHGGDVNVDHRRTFEAVTAACRPLPGAPVRTIATFETASGTEWRLPSDPHHFVPNVLVALREEDLAAKIAAMESYELERRPFPHPRSPEALRIIAQRWGLVVGEPLAEAFTLVRHVAT